MFQAYSAILMNFTEMKFLNMTKAPFTLLLVPLYIYEYVYVEKGL